MITRSYDLAPGAPSSADAPLVAGDAPVEKRLQHASISSAQVVFSFTLLTCLFRGITRPVLLAGAE